MTVTLVLHLQDQMINKIVIKKLNSKNIYKKKKEVEDFKSFKVKYKF